MTTQMTAAQWNADLAADLDNQVEQGMINAAERRRIWAKLRRKMTKYPRITIDVGQGPRRVLALRDLGDYVRVGYVKRAICDGEWSPRLHISRDTYVSRSQIITL